MFSMACRIARNGFVNCITLCWGVLLSISVLCSHGQSFSLLAHIRSFVTNPNTGSPFSGTIALKSRNTPAYFLSSFSMRVDNGFIDCILAPTQDFPGAYYDVTYFDMQGIPQGAQHWSVPVSSESLTISDVVMSDANTSTQIGPQYATLPIPISQVSNLSANLASINASVSTLRDAVDPLPIALSKATTSAAAASTSAADLVVRVAALEAAITSLKELFAGLNGSTVTNGNTPGLSDTQPEENEDLSSQINGGSVSVKLSHIPAPEAGLSLFRNGLLLTFASDFQLTGNTITFAKSAVPQVGDSLRASYRY